MDDELEDYEIDEEIDGWEDAAAECGLLPSNLGGGCMSAGSEHCDFECPFRDKPWLLTGQGEAK